MTPSELNMASSCKTRTLLELGCRGCLVRKNCIKFKFEHDGLSPHEYQKLETKEENEDVNHQ